MISIEEQLTTVCKHNREKKECKTCKKYCQHNTRKERCRLCGGSSICEHDKLKAQCRLCSGSSFCQHDKQKSRCRLCGGSSFCKHDKLKAQCHLCKGSSFCEHDKLKAYCRLCGGSQICEHDKQKRHCHLCGGSSFCQHDKFKALCQICEPIKYLVNIQRHQIWRIMQQTNIEKTQPSIEYLGCSAVYFKEYISKKMTAEMTFDNIHYDHIKPASVFDLNDLDELLKCCHYTNFQPLLATDNMEKSNKWNDETDAFWRENICGKEYYEIYNPF
jgi:hypothetical protein